VKDTFNKRYAQRSRHITVSTGVSCGTVEVENVDAEAVDPIENVGAVVPLPSPLGLWSVGSFLSGVRDVEIFMYCVTAKMLLAAPIFLVF